MFRNLLLAGLAATALAAPIGGAEAALINLGPGSFTPAATVITFSEPGRNVGDLDPVYTFGTQTVRFGELFEGQATSGGFPVTLSDPTPNSPLTLVQNGNTRIQGDASNPTSPVLSGSPTFNGPISIFFDEAVQAVGLDGGFFNAVGSTTIEAYDTNGNSLGTITNTQTGIEFYGLFDSGGANIKGISFYITGNEPFGFAIDNVTFGNADVVVGTPEPATLALFGVGLAALGAARRRR